LNSRVCSSPLGMRVNEHELFPKQIIHHVTHFQLRQNPSFLTTPTILSSRTRPIKTHSCAIQTKLITCLQHVRISTGLINLLLTTTPLWLIDSINPILDLHNDTSILLYCSRPVCNIEESLSGFQRHRTVLSPTGIYLEGFLVCEDVDLDPGPGGAEAGDRKVAPVVGRFAVGEVACICVQWSEFFPLQQN
jgi:hypothetical protein